MRRERNLVQEKPLTSVIPRMKMKSLGTRTTEMLKVCNIMTIFHAFWLAGFRFGLFVLQHVVRFCFICFLAILIIRPHEWTDVWEN